MAKFTIDVKYTLEELKEKYRIHFGCDDKIKITKADIAGWLASLAEADVETI